MILDMTGKLMVEEGYAAVSTRRIAQELGLNAATVHYYYPATDDIFIALHKRMIDSRIAELDSVRVADNPLAAFWEHQSAWSQTALGVEFLALSNHRKAIRDTLSAATAKAREAQAAALARALEGGAALPETLSPAALTTILLAIGRLIANEERVGIAAGHEDVRRFIA